MVVELLVEMNEFAGCRTTRAGRDDTTQRQGKVKSQDIRVYSSYRVCV